MTIKIWISDKIKFESKQFQEFVQQQANRLVVGRAQYGPASKEKMYQRRLGIELKEYVKTGNREHLLNIANYAWLESQAPQNPKFHWDNSVDSVTRGRV